MKGTPLPALHKVLGFACPQKRRLAAEHARKFKQIFGGKYSLYGKYVCETRKTQAAQKLS